MKDLLLFCVLAAAAVFGWGLMCRFDGFLGGQRQRREEECSTLRVAFEDPSMLEAAERLLESFTQTVPLCELRFFFGSREEILKKLESRELDFGFLSPLPGELPNFEGKSVFLPTGHAHGHVTVTCSLLEAVLPLWKQGELEVVWTEKGKHNAVYQDFAQLLMMRQD